MVSCACNRWTKDVENVHKIHGFIEGIAAQQLTRPLCIAGVEDIACRRYSNIGVCADILERLIASMPTSGEQEVPCVIISISEARVTLSERLIPYGNHLSVHFSGTWLRNGKRRGCNKAQNGLNSPNGSTTYGRPVDLASAM